MSDVELTNQDLAEALAIAAAVRSGQEHQRVEPRHVLAVVEWGARCEQEVMMQQHYLDKYDLEAVRKAMEARAS